MKILDFGIAHLDAPGTGSSPRLTAVGAGHRHARLHVARAARRRRRRPPRRHLRAGRPAVRAGHRRASVRGARRRRRRSRTSTRRTRRSSTGSTDGCRRSSTRSCGSACGGTGANATARRSTSRATCRTCATAGCARRRGPAAARTLSSPLWWWRVHQVCAILVESGLVSAVWHAHAVGRQDWTLALFLAYIATVAVNGTLRVHLLFTSAFNPPDMREQLRRTLPIVRGTDLLVALMLLIPAAAVRPPGHRPLGDPGRLRRRLGRRRRSSSSPPPAPPPSVADPTRPRIVERPTDGRGSAPRAAAPTLHRVPDAFDRSASDSVDSSAPTASGPTDPSVRLTRQPRLTRFSSAFRTTI